MTQPITENSQNKGQKNRLVDNLRKALPKIALESFFIVLSILLALAVNEWNKARQERVLQQEALRNIQKEITYNKQKLKESMAYHKIIRTKFSALMKTPDTLTKQPFLSIFSTIAPQGVRFPVLRSASWKIATSTNVMAGVDYTNHFDTNI